MLKRLNRFSYSLNRAMEYLNKDLGYETLKIEDLIHFIKKEKLITVFQMGGIVIEDRAAITSFCEKNLEEAIYLDDITLQYTESEYSRDKVKGLLKTYNQYFKNDFLEIEFENQIKNHYLDKIVRPHAILKNYADESECLSLNGFCKFSFKGYFKISFEQYQGSDKEIVSRGYIEIDPSFAFKTKTDEERKTTTSLNIYMKNKEQLIRLDFDSIEILHNDLERFVSSHGNINILESQENLKYQIEEKDKLLKELKKEIDELKNTMYNQDVPIFLNQFMENDRLFLAIQARKDYWHSYKPELSNAPKADPTTTEIQEKYNLSKKQAQAIEIVACPIKRN